MSQAGRFTPEVVPGTYIEQINGDIGFASGAIINLLANTSSGSSVFFVGGGDTLLFEVTDSNVNTIIGFNAGSGTITGIQNTALGAGALIALTTGSQNVMMGVGAGDQLLTGSYNIGIGFDAANAYTGSESSNILLNSTGTIGDSHTLRVGAGTGTGNGQLNKSFISGIQGITVTTADQVLVIDGSGQIGSIAPGTSGDVLTSQGAANNPIWTPPAPVSIDINGDIGTATGDTFTFTANPSAGASVIFDASVATVTFKVTDSGENTLIGLGSGNGTHTGLNNTALGYNTMLGLTNGQQNVAIGSQSAQSMQDGYSNVAIGFTSLGLNTSGNRNVAIGQQALGANISGIRNTVVGTGALVQSQGDDNIAIGHDVGISLISGSNNIYIGENDADTSAESFTMRLGNVGTTTATYIYGIGGIDVGATANVVVEDGDQLGTAVLVAGTNIAITTGSNSITISGDPAVIMNYVTVTNATSPYTVLADDNYISANVTAGTVTIRLPNAPTIGRVFTIKDKVGLSATNNITVTTVGGTVTIDGATSFVMNTAYEAISVIFNGLTYEVW